MSKKPQPQNLVNLEKLYLAKQSYDYLKIRLNTCKKSEMDDYKQLDNLLQLYYDAEFQLMKVIDEICEAPK